MAAVLTVIPNPTTPSSTVNVHGTGFNPNETVKLNSGGAFKVRSDGTFDVPLVAPNAAGNYTVSVLKGSTILATTTFGVQVPIPPPPPAVTPPSVPQNLVATAGDTLITLNWGIPVSNGGGTITNYIIYRGGVFFIQLGAVTSYTNVGLSNGTPYSYTVSAKNSAGEGPQTASVTQTPVSTAPPPTLPVISNIVKSNIAGTSAVISWHVSVVAQGWIEYGTTTSYGSLTTKELSFNYQDHVQTISGLLNGTTYHFKIHAVDQLSQEVTSPDDTFTTTSVAITAPTAPLSLMVSLVSAAQANLVWNAPTSNGGSVITNYRIYVNNTLFTIIGNVTNYTNTNLSGGTTYSYTVSAVNSAGEGPKSSAVAILTAPVLSAIVGSTIVNLTWSGSVASYKVYRNSALIASPTTNGYTDTGLVNGQQYSYQVSAVNAAGEGPKSNTVFATPTAALSRPFLAPVTTQTVNVPTTIDSTGAINVAPALQTFIGSVSDGSIIAFKAGGVYRLDTGLSISDRHNLVFEGNAATLRGLGPGGSMWSSPFVLYGPNVSDIVIHNFTIEGNNPRTGNDIYDPATESSHGVAIHGASRVEVYGNTIRKTGGDGVYVANPSTQDWADGVWVHDNTFRYLGRMVLTIIAGQNVLLENNNADFIGGSFFDIEPDLDFQGANYITLKNNIVGTWAMTIRTVWWWAQGANQTVAPNAAINNITITGNTSGTPFSSGYSSSFGGLASWFGKPGYRMKNIVFTNNTTTKAAAGPILKFEHIDGLTVRGNTQPLTSGSLLYLNDCTGVVLT